MIIIYLFIILLGFVNLKMAFMVYDRPYNNLGYWVSAMNYGSGLYNIIFGMYLINQLL